MGIPNKKLTAGEYFRLKQSPSPGLCAVRGCRRKHRVEGRLCEQHNKALYRANNPLRYAYVNLRDNARRRRKAFSLSFEEFQALVLPTAYLDARGRTRYCLHLDRIDPLKGYEVGNLQIITCAENCHKGATSDKRKYVERLWVNQPALPIDGPGECPF